MKLFATAYHQLEAARRQLRARSRLLAAAFARHLPALPQDASVQPNVVLQQVDLLNGLNVAGQAAGIQVWDWDLVANTLKFDRTQMDRFGGAPYELETNPEQLILRAVHTDDLAHYRREFVRALKGEVPLCIDYRVLHADGSIHPVQLRGEVFRGPPIEGQSSRAIRVVGFTIDMGAQQASAKHSEQQALQLQQWIERINLATETAGIGMWDWDLASGKLSSDTNMSGIFKDADLTGITNATDFVAKILHPDDREQFITTMQTAIRRNGTDRVSTNFRYLRNDGGVHHVELHGRIVRNEQGRAERFLGISWNVTAKVEAQAEIERQSAAQHTLLERLNLATEVAGIDVWDWDLITDRITADTRIANAYDSNHLEFQSGQQLIAEIVHPEDLPGYLAAINRALESGQNLIYRFRLVAPNGGPQHLQVHARVLRDSQGKAVRLLGVSLDVTEEIKHVTELRRQADEERALRDRLNLATKTAGIGIWDKDLVGGAFVCDEQFWTLLGLTPDSQFKVHDVIHPSEREQALAPLNVAMADASRDEILAIRHRTSNPRHEPQFVQTHMRVFRDSQGKPIRLLGATWDVTDEMVHAEEVRRQAEHERALIERLNVTTKAAGISPWEFDIKANCFSWHGPRPACFGMDHVPVADYFRELATIVLPEDLHLLLGSGKQAMESNLDSYEYRFRVQGIDAKIHHMHNYARVMRSERGNIRYIVGVTWDVTKEVEAADRLQVQADQERTLINRLNVATQAAGISPWEFDLKTNNYLWFGARLAVLGLDNEPTETCYEALLNIVLPEDRNVLHDAAVAAITNGTDMYSAQYRANGNDGQVHYLKNFVRVLRSARGTPYRLVGVTWDVSEEVAAKEQLRQQAEHERALIDRLNLTTQAAGISPWEFDLKTSKLTWLGIQLTALGLNEIPVDQYMAALRNAIIPEDVLIMDDAAQQAFTSGAEVYSYRYRARGTDGQIHHMKNFVRILRSTRGTPYRLVGVTWDVSEEVAASERLKEQAQHANALKERLSIAAMAAGISPFEIDLTTGKFLWVENPIKALTGIRGSDNALTTFSQRIHADDVNLFRDEIVRAAKGGHDVVTYSYRAIANDDSLVHVKTYAKLYFNEKRRAIRALGVSWDATPEVEAAAQLQQQTERLRDVERRLERASLSSSEGHWEAELATGHLWCSSSFHTLLGYLEGELEARVSAFDHLVYPEDRVAYHDALRNHLVDNVAYDVNTRLRMSNGEYRWFRMRGMAERDSDGQPIVMAGSIHDVQQQKLVEDALILAQHRFERAINGTQDGLWELDVDTDNAWCSPRVALLLGYEASHLGTDNFLRSLIHPDDVAKIAKVTTSHYRHNTPFDTEVRLQTLSSEYRWFRARATADRDSNGRAVRLSGSLQDVTDARVAREELVRATEAAEAASRAKSAFLANVSHEIRTPMNGIIGMTGLLIDTQLDRTQRDYANTIRGSADSLLTVINDILDFSKIEAGKLDLENIELDLRTNVEEVGAMMAFQAANKNLELIINVHPEVPDYVFGDPQRIRQCLINLIGNAIKFTKQGEIVVDVCAVGRQEGAVLTHFEVRDTGMGIPDATLKTLFQPFVQADSSTTRHFGGTGLGLSIVRRLVEMMGGQVGVVSELGVGSNFFFTLSLEPKEDAMPLPLKRSIKGGRILIVDDNATNCRVLATLLTHQGYRVTQADSGAAALMQLQSGELVDMVITDYQMPGMDGLALGERITSDPSLTHLRLVMLTSLDGQGDGKRLAALGFAAYLTKPVRTRELLDCVAHVLSGEARQWQMEMRPMITRNALSQAIAQQRFAGRVLLVEDNLVNQKVAARFLERMGCTVRIANDGADGVAAFQEEPFDIIFMDLQMPVMDGLAAARKIRELESADLTRQRTPIVALTANAMRGDQERCEAAGMDGFLTKPIEIERLRDMLTKFDLNAPEAAAVLGSSETQTTLEESATPPPINLARLNEITGDDAAFAKELIDTFIASGEAQLIEIRTAIDSHDRDALARAAHKLKGACANIHAEEARALVAKLETEAATATDSELHAGNALLHRAFARAKEFLNDPSVTPAPIRAAS